MAAETAPSTTTRGRIRSRNRKRHRDHFSPRRADRPAIVDSGPGRNDQKEMLYEALSPTISSQVCVRRVYIAARKEENVKKQSNTTGTWISI